MMYEATSMPITTPASVQMAVSMIHSTVPISTSHHEDGDEDEQRDREQACESILRFHSSPLSIFFFLIPASAQTSTVQNANHAGVRYASWKSNMNDAAA